VPHRAKRLVAVVSLLALSVLAPGCWLVHGRGDPIGRAVDAGTDAHLPPGTSEDAGIVPIDAPSSIHPPPLHCALTRPDVSCFESFLVQPGRPFELPFAFDQCACCAETECAVSVDAATQTLSLTTTLCPDPCDCDACRTPRGTCAVPALEEGLWSVVVNDFPAFQLPVSEDGGFVPPPPACATYAQVDRCEPAFPFAGLPFELADACLETGSSVSGLDVLRIHDPCGTCTLLDAPCYASLEPRLTDDLPPGGDLHVFGGEYGTACDVDCPGVCVPRDHQCFAPPLVRGDVYRVFVGDTRLTTFVAGDPSAACPD
jgi:hypothetical protein